MLAIVIANRKQLLLSVAVCCLPYAAFGMKDDEVTASNSRNFFKSMDIPRKLSNAVRRGLNAEELKEQEKNQNKKLSESKSSGGKPPDPQQNPIQILPSRKENEDENVQVSGTESQSETNPKKHGLEKLKQKIWPGSHKSSQSAASGTEERSEVEEKQRKKDKHKSSSRTRSYSRSEVSVSETDVSGTEKKLKKKKKGEKNIENSRSEASARSEASLVEEQSFELGGEQKSTPKSDSLGGKSDSRQKILLSHRPRRGTAPESPLSPRPTGFGTETRAYKLVRDPTKTGASTYDSEYEDEPNFSYESTPESAVDSSNLRKISSSPVISTRPNRSMSQSILLSATKDLKLEPSSKTDAEQQEPQQIPQSLSSPLTTTTSTTTASSTTSTTVLPQQEPPSTNKDLSSPRGPNRRVFKKVSHLSEALINLKGFSEFESESESESEPKPSTRNDSQQVLTPLLIPPLSLPQQEPFSTNNPPLSLQPNVASKIKETLLKLDQNKAGKKVTDPESRPKPTANASQTSQETLPPLPMTPITTTFTTTSTASTPALLQQVQSPTRSSPLSRVPNTYNRPKQKTENSSSNNQEPKIIPSDSISKPIDNQQTLQQSATPFSASPLTTPSSTTSTQSPTNNRSTLPLDGTLVREVLQEMMDMQAVSPKPKSSSKAEGNKGTPQQTLTSSSIYSTTTTSTTTTSSTTSTTVLPKQEQISTNTPPLSQQTNASFVIEEKLLSSNQTKSETQVSKVGSNSEPLSNPQSLPSTPITSGPPQQKQSLTNNESLSPSQSRSVATRQDILKDLKEAKEELEKFAYPQIQPLAKSSSLTRRPKTNDKLKPQISKTELISKLDTDKQTPQSSVATSVTTTTSSTTSSTTPTSTIPQQKPPSSDNSSLSQQPKEVSELNEKTLLKLDQKKQEKQPSKNKLKNSEIESDTDQLSFDDDSSSSSAGEVKIHDYSTDYSNDYSNDDSNVESKVIVSSNLETPKKNKKQNKQNKELKRSKEYNAELDSQSVDEGTDSDPRSKITPYSRRIRLSSTPLEVEGDDYIVVNKHPTLRVPFQRRFMSSNNPYLKPQHKLPTSNKLNFFATKKEQNNENIQSKFISMQFYCSGKSSIPLESLGLAFYLETTGDKSVQTWPTKIKENIVTIKPKDLLNKFWGYTFTENLANCWGEFSPDILELIGSSAAFLMNNMSAMTFKLDKEQAYIKNLCKTFLDCCDALSKNSQDTQKDSKYYSYYSAKYFATIESYAEAWLHLVKCGDFSECIDGDGRGEQYYKATRDAIKPKKSTNYPEENKEKDDSYKKKCKELSNDDYYKELAWIKNLIAMYWSHVTKMSMENKKIDVLITKINSLITQDNSKILPDWAKVDGKSEDYTQKMDRLTRLKTFLSDSNQTLFPNKKIYGIIQQINRLTKGLSNLAKRMNDHTLTEGKQYLEFAHVVEKINIIENNYSKNPEQIEGSYDKDAAVLYLEGAKCLYNYNPEQTKNEIKGWDLEMLFHLARTAESRAPHDLMNSKVLQELSKVFYTRVHEKYGEDASNGNLDAQFSLGWMYANGYGVEQDFKIAALCYEEAAKEGYAKAQASLGALYQNGEGGEQNYEQAANYYQKAADQGIMDAQYNLGWLCEKGLGVQKDVALAAQWYDEAAKQGHIEANSRLGIIHELGDGVQPNDEIAAHYYKVAAELGDATAQIKLSLMYKEGRGVSESPKKAFKWCKKAADQENAEAQFNLGWMYQNAYVVKIDNAKAIELYENSAKQGYAEAQYSLGLLYSQDHTVKENINIAVDWLALAAGQGHEEAIKCYTTIADKGHVGAQAGLGQLYERSDYVPEDLEKAVKYYELAILQKNATAQFYLGLMYLEGRGVAQNIKKGLQYMEEAASQGNPEMQVELGMIYEEGDGVPKDSAKAMKWYKAAADGEDATGQYKLGYMYGYVQKDVANAFEWFTKAAINGHVDAQYNLGLMHAKGHHVPVNFETAREYYELAANQGHKTAQLNIGLMYANGHGVEQSNELAEQWFVEATDGNPEIQATLGTMYEEGKLLPQDLEKAMQWYQAAADKENAMAQYKLGLIYHTGSGVEKNDDTAFQLFKLAAEKGNASAQYNLAWMYQNGCGVGKSTEEAVKWYNDASKQGHEKAKESLDEMLKYASILTTPERK